MEVDPEDEHNLGIVDLDFAPRNAAGRVEYATDVEILKPIDVARGNNRIFYGVVNRGYKNLVSFMNDAPRANNLVSAEHAGNGFLMREGYTLVPLKLYFNQRGIAKLEIGLARGKRQADKRQTEKERDWNREKARLIRDRG